MNLPEGIPALRGGLDLYDAVPFFMLADAACSGRPAVDIEKIHVNIFKKGKIARPRLSEGQQETLEILNDAILMKELESSMAEAKEGRAVPWTKARVSP